MNPYIRKKISLVGLSHSLTKELRDLTADITVFDSLNQWLIDAPEPEDSIIVTPNSNSLPQKDTRDLNHTSWITADRQLVPWLISQGVEKISFIEGNTSPQELRGALEKKITQSLPLKEHFNPREALRFFGDDTELFSDLFGIFQNSAQIHFEKCIEELHAGDWHAATRSMHTLKGAIGVFGKNPALFHIRAYEKAVKEQRVENIEEFSNLIKDEIDIIKQNISQFLN